MRRSLDVARCGCGRRSLTVDGATTCTGCGLTTISLRTPFDTCSCPVLPVSVYVQARYTIDSMFLRASRPRRPDYL